MSHAARACPPAASGRGAKRGSLLAIRWAKYALLLALCLGEANAAPFSHKFHLQLKLDCATCHSAAAASTRAEDNLLPAKAVCARCHDDGRDVPAPQPTRVARFNHALHLKLGNIAPILAAAIDKGQYLSAPGDLRSHLNGSNQCLACHRGIDQSDHVTAANMPRMADCLVCHNQIELPFSCEKCHAKDADLRPASHAAPGFVDSHSSKTLMPDKSSCAVCHGRRFQCMGCH